MNSGHGGIVRWANPGQYLAVIPGQLPMPITSPDKTDWQGRVTA